MKNVSQIVRVLAAVLIGVTFVSSLAHAQQTNPNKLPQCPRPDNSKKTDIERFAKWTNCWGRYKFELDSNQKGDVLEGEWINGALHGVGIYTYANGDKYVGEFRGGSQNGQGVYTKTAANLESDRKLLEKEKEKENKRLKELANNKLDLHVTHSAPGLDGSFFVNVKINTIVSSLKIDDEELGGKAAGTYLIKRIALPRQSSSFKLVAKDTHGNTDTKVITIDLSTKREPETKLSESSNKDDKTFNAPTDFEFSPKHFIPKLKDYKLCDSIRPTDVEKVLYVWTTIDANVEKNSAETCLNQETKYLNKYIDFMNKKSSDSELVSDSTKYQRKALHIKEHIKELTAANCVWKSLDAINEPAREKAKSGMNKLDDFGLSFVSAAQLDETAIDLDIIYTNFKENKYNLSALFKRVNSYLNSTSVDFKSVYFKRESAAGLASQKMIREVELEKARKTGRRFDQTSEKATNAFIAANAIGFRMHVPNLLEFLAVGSCPKDDTPSLIGDYIESSSILSTR